MKISKNQLRVARIMDLFMVTTNFLGGVFYFISGQKSLAGKANI